MKQRNLFPFLGTALLCAFAASASVLPRLAVLAEDSTAESRNMADLMQLELSSRADMEMVERAEIERILREQEISAAGLADTATRVQLGKTLKANGLVFTGSRNARVVETSDGFLAGVLSHPQRDTAARASAALSAGVIELLPKLTRNPELHTCATILRFNTAMIGTANAHENEKRFDALMLERLTAALCAEPDVLVMERRRTLDLSNEAGLAGERARLKSGTLLLDGELASALMEATDMANPSVVLTVRIRDLSGRTIEPVRVRGFRAELETLMDDAVLQTVETVRRNLRVGSQETLKAEVAALLNVAQSKNMSVIEKQGENRLWAGEAAYALDPKNPKVRDELIGQLCTGESHPDSILARYYGYVRMEQIFRETGMSFHEYVLNSHLSRQLISDLSNEESHSYPELTALLRPLRQAMAQTVEKSYSTDIPSVKKGALLARMVAWTTALAGTNRERQVLRHKIFERVVSDSGIDDEARNIALGYMLTHHNWRLGFLEEQARSNDPVRRYYALCRLMWQGNDAAKKRQYATAAAREIDALLEQRGALGLAHWRYLHISKTSYTDPKSLQNANHWFIFLMRHICTICPEMKKPLTRKVFERAKVLLAEKNYEDIQRLEPHITFLDIPDAEFLAWIDELLKDEPPWNSKLLFEDLRNCAKDIRPRVMPEPPKVSSLKREVMFTLRDFEQKWRLPELRWRWNENGSYDRSDLLPCRLLLDNDTLWVALGGRWIMRKNSVVTEPYGLVAINTKTGKITGGRFGSHECLSRNRSIQSNHPGYVSRPGPKETEELHLYPALSLTRIGGYILAPYGGAGVCAFPANANTSDMRGVEWLDINTPQLSKSENRRLTFFVTGGGVYYLCVDDLFILSWTPPKQTTTVIFDANQQLAGIQMQEFHKRVEAMWFDTDTGKLFVSGRYWERAGTGMRGREVFHLSFNPQTSGWALLDEKPEQPVSVLSQTARKFLADDSDELVVDVAPVDESSFYALVGFGTKWRLEKVKVRK